MKVLSDSAFRYAMSLFVVMRVFISRWAAPVLVVTKAPPSPDDVLRPYQGVDRFNGGVAELLLGVRQRSDAVDYQRIAPQGYTDDLSSAFPPLLPGLVRPLGQVRDGNCLPTLKASSNLSMNPKKVWLDAHDHLTSAVAFRDLQMLVYRLA